MQRRHYPLFAAEGTGSGGGEGAGSGAGDAGQAGGSGSKPWYDGHLDAELIGHAQNKQWDVSDPVKAAAAAIKAHREAERFVGVPANRLIKLPEKDDDTAGWNGVYQRLGVPADAKDYDFSGVKFSDGTELDAAFTDKMRSALAAARVPKDRAPTVTKAVVEYLEEADKAESTERTAKIDAEKAELKKNWGPNYDLNKLRAMEGAKRLGITAEAITALEGQVGYAAVMDAMRKIGAGTSEDTFVEGKGSNSNPMTQQGAVARKAELMADKDWAARYLKGGAQEKREMFALDAMIAGVTEAA
jgi:hypothetical protein